MRLVSVDPGGTTGFAVFRSGVGRWEFEKVGIRYELEEVADMLWEYTPDIVVVESFRLYPWKNEAQMWSEFKTVQIIGACKTYAHRTGSEIILQGASVKSIGYKQGGVKELPKSNPMNHAHDAHAHGAYYIYNKLKGVIV